MHGLVSLLDPEHYFQVEAIWNELEGDCGLTGIKITPKREAEIKLLPGCPPEDIETVIEFSRGGMSAIFILNPNF